MPTPEAITRLLATMAHELAWLAIGWHVAILGALAALVLGRRPSRRTACVLLAAPLASVALASVAYGNAFNAISFSALALLLAVVGGGLADARASRGPTWTVVAGWAAMAFGLAYPHFVEGSWVRVLAAAPLGVVPCPTLAFVAGATIVAGGFGSLVVPAALALWVAFYAWFGVARLGVTLDLGLAVAFLGLLGVLRIRESSRLRAGFSS